jgi:hypothetical protein
LTQVGSKLQVVLLPRENQDGVLKKLKDCTCRREKGGAGGRKVERGRPSGGRRMEAEETTRGRK